MQRWLSDNQYMTDQREDAEMDLGELALKEYEALQAEKNGRIQARLQIWSVFLALVGAFFLAGLQAGLVSWAILIYPIAAAFLAQFAGHNETVLDRLKTYLRAFEARYGYDGYEQFNFQIKTRSGSQVKALRSALIATEVLATVVGIAHLLAEQHFLLASVATVIEIVTVVSTFLFLRDE